MQKPTLPVALPSLPEKTPAAAKPKQKRGFALLSAERQREIASKGGTAAHIKGTAHEFSSLEARQAGIKGGLSVSRDIEHMARIGRAGGMTRKKNIEKARVDKQEAPGAQVTGVTEAEDAGVAIESVGC